MFLGMQEMVVVVVPVPVPVPVLRVLVQAGQIAMVTLVYQVVEDGYLRKLSITLC